VHIVDGILPIQMAAGAHVVALGTAARLSRRLQPAEIPRVGLLTAGLFVASLLHIPLAGTSIHLGLFGLAGVLLGRRAFPAVFAALLMQALFFQHGGLLSLGMNSLNMGLGAIAASWVWGRRKVREPVRAFAAGALGIVVPAALMAVEFLLVGYGTRLLLLAGVYVAVAALEGFLTVAAVAFLRATEPALLERPS
jgi:cobalt/nickel transport system permease protein